MLDDMKGLGNSVCFCLHRLAVIGAHHVFCLLVLGLLRCAVLAEDGRGRNMLAQELSARCVI